MTNTTPAAVERFYFMSWGMAPSIGGTWVSHSDYAALSAQLEAANQRAEMLADSVAKARAEGKAEGLREAAGCIGHITRFEDLDAILALIPADTPAAADRIEELEAKLEALDHAYDSIVQALRFEALRTDDAETKLITCATNAAKYGHQCLELSAQLEAANQRALELEAAIDSIETSHGLTSNGNMWRFWSKKATEAVGQLEAAHAKGKAEGLREAAGLFAGDSGKVETYYRTLALIPADTPACDTKTAENVTQDALCKSNAVQEAAQVLLGDDFTSPLLEVLDAYNNDYQVGQDVLKALRAIAGGRDE